MTMRRKLLSLGLGATLAVGSIGTAFAQTPAQHASQSLQEFNAYVANNWSRLGYSSLTADTGDE